MARAASATYVLEYKGDYAYHTDLEQPSTGTSVKVDELYTWDEQLTTIVSDQGQTTSQPTLTAAGTLRRLSVHNGQTDFLRSCTISALALPDLSRLTLTGGALPGSVDAHAYLPATAVAPGRQPAGGEVTVGAAADNLNGDCAAYDNGAFALGCQAGTCFDGCLGFPASSDWDRAFDLTLTGSTTPSVSQAGGASQSNAATCSTGVESGQRSIHATLTLVNPGAGGAGPLLPAGPHPAPRPGAPAVPASPPPAPVPAAAPAAPPLPGPAPAAPDTSGLMAQVSSLARLTAARCADARLGTALDRSPVGSGAGGLDRLLAMGVTGAELFGAQSIDCGRSFAEWRTTSVRVAGRPGDSRYTEIALPRPWPATRGRAPACAPGRTAAVCRTVKRALADYAVVAARRASLTEVLGVVAERAAGARAAWGQDPLAPGGLALQTALARAYSGDLVATSRAERRAVRALNRSLARAGLGALRLSAGVRRAAALRLATALPPASLVTRLAGEGMGSPTELRAAFRALVARARIRSTALGGSLFRSVVAREIPAESYFALTLGDLARLAAAVADPGGRAALGADIATAQAGPDATARRAAIVRFIADAATTQTGELSRLLQKAAEPLLR